MHNYLFGQQHSDGVIRKEAIMQAEKARHIKYKKQEEERETVRQNLRDKVFWKLQ